MLTDDEIQKLFKELEQKHGQPSVDGGPQSRDEVIGHLLSVESIRDIADDFDLPLEVVRNLTNCQYFWLLMEGDVRNPHGELPFEVEEQLTDMIDEVRKAKSVTDWLERRDKRRAKMQSSPLLPKQKFR